MEPSVVLKNLVSKKGPFTSICQRNLVFKYIDRDENIYTLILLFKTGLPRMQLWDH